MKWNLSMQVFVSAGGAAEVVCVKQGHIAVRMSSRKASTPEAHCGVVYSSHSAAGFVVFSFAVD